MIFALAAALFAACSKGDEEPVPQGPEIDRVARILYWDGEKLALGQWGTVTLENILYTKFGSLVAFTITSYEDEWDAGDVKFTPLSRTYDDYESIADMSLEGGPEHSVADQHTEMDIGLGLGDICKLVGLTTEQARSRRREGTLHEYDSGFRLPNRVDNTEYFKDLVTTDEPTNGVWLSDDPTVNSFLPTIMYWRDYLGDVFSLSNATGRYWAGYSYDDGNGYSMMLPHESESYASGTVGYAVRCVRDE